MSENKNCSHSCKCTPSYLVGVKGASKEAFNTAALKDATESAAKDIRTLFASEKTGSTFTLIEMPHLGVVRLTCSEAFADKVRQLPSVQKVTKLRCL